MNNKKIVIVGTGFVGMSMLYAMIDSDQIDEILLIDENQEKAEGEKIDLLNALVFTRRNIKINIGTYDQCKDADIVVITAGTNKREFKTRLDMIEVNKKIAEEITQNVVKSGFNGIFLIATNPVDIISYVVKKVSDFEARKVIGTGTILDTARLIYLLGEKFKIDTKDIETYVLGEHGDSSFPLWNYTNLNGQSIEELSKLKNIDIEELENIHREVIKMGYNIATKKGATYYGIAMSLKTIIKAILNDENAKIVVSTYLNGEYNNYDVYAGVPCIINKNGVSEIIELELIEDDKIKMNNSCNILKEVINKNIS